VPASIVERVLLTLHETLVIASSPFRELIPMDRRLPNFFPASVNHTPQRRFSRWRHCRVEAPPTRGTQTCPTVRTRINKPVGPSSVTNQVATKEPRRGCLKNYFYTPASRCLMFAVAFSTTDAMHEKGGDCDAIFPISWCRLTEPCRKPGPALAAALQ